MRLEAEMEGLQMNVLKLTVCECVVVGGGGEGGDPEGFRCKGGGRVGGEDPVL